MNRASEVPTKALRMLCGQVEHWRRHRGAGRSVVPEDIWSAAVEVARVEGVYATSKALRFNYNSLRDRLVLADSPERGDGTATFVEVPMPSHAPHTSAAVGQTVVELVGSGGAHMRVDVTGASSVDIVALARAFWSREP